MKRTITLVAVLVLALATMAAPASAHVLVVDPPGADEPKVAWVGGPPLPGKGQGLIPGGPPHEPIVQSPSHAKGLNTACEKLRKRGNGVVDIFGPGGPGCPHGS